MGSNQVKYSDRHRFDQSQVMGLYQANAWSAAEKPDLLFAALIHSDTVISAWIEEKLVGLGNAISDKHLVVYFPHLLVLPEYQGRGIGRGILNRLMQHYRGFHQQVLIAENGSVEFYQRCGFKRAGKTEPMWIYEGKDLSER